MNLEEIKAYLKENADDAEVKDFLNSLSAVTTDKVESFLETEDGKRLLQPRLDKYFAKGLESWKEKNLQSIVDEKLKEINPEETPEQKQIRELTERLNKAEQEKKRHELLTKVSAQLAEKKLPTDVASLLVAGGEDALETNLETFTKAVEAVQESVRKEIIKENGRDGILGGAGTGNKKEDELDKIADEFFGEKQVDKFAEKASEQFFGETKGE